MSEPSAIVRSAVSVVREVELRAGDTEPPFFGASLGVDLGRRVA